ncbi:MAG: AMP-binding protein, partial [Clostridia bacterium]|nr:AMP-binding protein [Clostridia bacterium]
MDRIWTQHYDPIFQTTIDYPEKTMYGLVRDRAARYPAQTALSFMGRRMSYEEMLGLVDRMADRLSMMGFTRGTVATICLPNIPDAVIAFYAVNRLGGVANMVHPLSPAEELQHYIQTTDSEFLFILDAFLPKHLSILERSRIRTTIVSSVPDYLPPLMSVGFWVKSGRKIPKVRCSDRIIKWNAALAAVPG